MGSNKNSTQQYNEEKKRKGGPSSNLSSQANSPAAHLDSLDEQTSKMHKQIMKR